MIIGCIHRHPTSSLSILDFNNEIMEPMLEKITAENKICSLLGDFNINLLNNGLSNDTSLFFNTLSSHFFASHILQPSRPTSKTLIDNIFINSIEYKSTSGNITIQISDHLIQFVLLEGFYKELIPRNLNLYERNYKDFNEREFSESLNIMNWDKLLCFNANDANLSLNQLYTNINYLLDESAPYKKLTKKDYKLKLKPWINQKILSQIKDRDKLLHKLCKLKDPNLREEVSCKYKRLRNSITKLKRESKKEYYKNYFERHKSNASSIWKGIRSIVKINQHPRKDIKIIDDNGRNVSNPTKIANHFNEFFVNIGTNIDDKIPQSKNHYSDFLKDISYNESFILSPTTTEEISDLISSLDSHKSLGPNSLPTFILQSSNLFFAEKLSSIINLSFETGMFPDLCKVAKVILIYKKDNPLLCVNYRPISLLPIFSKIFEKSIYSRMYAYLTDNNMIYKRQFGFRANHSCNHALISCTESIKKN